MPRTEFPELLHNARVAKAISLRQLASLSGIEYSRLSRMEHGTRPAPGLPALRRLAELLSLDIVDLLVSTGTSREVIEQLLWTQRIHEVKQAGSLGEYYPGIHRLHEKNRFAATVVSREGAYCRARIGESLWSLVTFSDDSTLSIMVPPESVSVFASDPSRSLHASENVFHGEIVKQRRFGSLLNDVIQEGSFELNAVGALHPTQDPAWRPGDSVYFHVPPASISTEPLEEEDDE